MTPSSSAAEASERISTREAAGLMAVSVTVVQRMIREGKLSVQAIPGTRPKLFRTEVERLVRESTRRAPAQSAGSERAAN